MCAGFLTYKSFAGGAIDASVVSAPLGDWLHADYAPVDLLNDTVGLWMRRRRRMSRGSTRS
jgi:hypothetical protein